MALLGDVTANAASTNHKDPPQHYPVPERNATFDPRLRSFPFTMMDHASDIVEDGEELEELPHPNISVRNEPPNALPLPDALPHETREFVLHALCEEQYDLVQTDPALVERIYRSWSGDGAYLRSASHAQLKSACHGSSLAALSLAFEIQRLLREEMERAEMERASAAAEQPPRPAEALEAGPEGPRKTGKMPSALARFGMAFMAATGFVGCGLHPPDLVLSEVSPSPGDQLSMPSTTSLRSEVQSASSSCFSSGVPSTAVQCVVEPRSGIGSDPSGELLGLKRRRGLPGSGTYTG